METFEMRDGFEEAGIEKETQKFVYIDHSKPEQPIVIFEWEAKDILEADEEYKKHFGIDVTSQSHIGCAVEEK